MGIFLKANMTAVHSYTGDGDPVYMTKLWFYVKVGTQKETLTIVCHYLLSIIILGGFVVDEHEVPLVAISTAQIVHQIRAILQTSVTL